MTEKSVKAFKSAESLITKVTGEPLSKNQILFLIVAASANPEGISDIKTFCETRGIGATSVQAIGELLYFSEESLIETWKNCEEQQEEMRQDPRILARQCAQIEKGLMNRRGGRR